MSQHPPRASVSRRFSQLLQAHSRSHQYLLHLPFPWQSSPPPPVSARRHHLFLQTVCPHHVLKNTSSSVLWLSVTMTSLLSFPLSPAASTRSFSSLSTPPSQCRLNHGPNGPLT